MRCADLPRRELWRSLPWVTHGDVWLPSSTQPSAAGLRTSSYCARRPPRTSAATAVRPGCTASRTCGSSFAGAPNKASTRSQRSRSTLSGTCAGCRTCASTSRPLCPGGYRSWSVLPDLRHRRHPAALARRLRPPAHRSRRIPDPRTRAPAVRSPAHGGTPVDQPERLRPDRAPRPARTADLRNLRREHQRPRRGTRSSTAAGPRQGRQGRAHPAATGRGPSDRTRRGRPHRGADPA
jgi:hypothetical protein